MPYDDDDEGGACKAFLGAPTTMIGLLLTLGSMACGIGSLVYLGENHMLNQVSQFNFLIVTNCLSLCVYAIILLVPFCCANKVSNAFC